MTLWWIASLCACAEIDVSSAWEVEVTMAGTWGSSVRWGICSPRYSDPTGQVKMRVKGPGRIVIFHTPIYKVAGSDLADGEVGWCGWRRASCIAHSARGYVGTVMAANADGSLFESRELGRTLVLSTDHSTRRVCVSTFDLGGWRRSYLPIHEICSCTGRDKLLFAEASGF